LRADSEPRLNNERIRQQTQEAAGVARGIEEIRIASRRILRSRKPALQQRSRRGNHQVRNANGLCQLQKLPDHRKPEGGAVTGKLHGQKEERRPHQEEMNRRLNSRVSDKRQAIHVDVASQQRDLKEQNCRRPDGCRPAK
jgi:hypothetical protein